MASPRSRVLVIDDSPVALRTVEAALAREGYEIATVTSGEEALRAVRTFDPHLILLDIMMPGMDGYAVCRRLREHEAYRKIPIVMLTAMSDTEAMVRSLEAGADDFVGKPFNKWELRARVAVLVRLGVQQRAAANSDRFLWAIEHSDDGFVLLDRTDRIVLCNAAARRLLTQEGEDPVGALFFEALSKDTVPEPPDAWERWGSAEGHSVPFCVVRTNQETGEHAWVLVMPYQHPEDPDHMTVVRLRAVLREMVHAPTA